MDNILENTNVDLINFSQVMQKKVLLQRRVRDWLNQMYRLDENTAWRIFKIVNSTFGNSSGKKEAMYRSQASPILQEVLGV